MVKIFEKIKFHYRMILLNRRNSIVMFLGFGISLALIAQSLMFMFSFQYGAFLGFYKQVPERQLTLGLSSFDISGLEGAGVPELNDIITTSIESAEIKDRVKRIDWFMSRGLFTVIRLSDGNDSFIFDFNLYAIPPDYFSSLESILYNGTLPQKIDDVIVVANANTLESSNISELSTIPCYTPMFMMTPEQVIATGFPEAGGFLNVSGIIKKETFANVKGNNADDFAAMADYFSENFMITSYTNFENFVANIGYLAGYAQPTGRISFFLEKINSFDLRNEISMLNRLSQEATRDFELAGFDIHIYPQLVGMLEQFNREFVMFQLFGVLFITPIIGMALSLTNYSANLLKRRQKRQISSMLQRGCSRQEVMLNLILQVVELTISALLIAFMVGYLFTWLLTSSTGFLIFGGNPITPTVNVFIVITIITAGFVLALIVNSINIWEMSQITTQEAYMEHQDKKPFWEKAFLDVIMFVVGIVFWLIVRLQLTGRAAYDFAMGIGTTAIILTILGGVLIIARIYPMIIEFLSNITWKTEKLEIFGLATKRSARRKSDTGRSLILITLTFTLIFASIVTVESYQSFDQENANYTIGADILISSVNTYNDDAKNQVLAIEGVNSASYIRTTSQIVTYGGLTYSFKIIGINPVEFAQTAYFDDEYIQDNDPVEFFSAIQNNNDVVMQRDQLELINLTTGNQINIRYEKYPVGIINRTLNVVGIYDYFPRFYNEEPDPDASIFRFNIVGTFENVQEFTYSTFSYFGDLIVDVEDDYNIDEVADSIEDTLGRAVQSSEDIKSTFDGSLRNTMLYGSTNATFISSIIITIAAITLMILIQAIEKEREVVTLKVLGMSPQQLFKMFLTESMSLVVFGAIFGSAIGTFAASMFTDILTFEITIPQNELAFPPLQLGLAVSVLILTSIAAAALTSWVVFRKDTIRAIKQI